MSAEQELITLRARIVELETRVEFLYKKLGVEFSNDPTSVDPRIADWLRKGNIIEAIKVYREIHNVGLAEAKQAVEAMKGRV